MRNPAVALISFCLLIVGGGGNFQPIMTANIILSGDNINTLKTLPDNFVDCCITSPPYYGLRDYGIDNQIGLEETPEKYVEKLVDVFREVRRVLREDGTLWINIGDSYAGSGKGGQSEDKRSESWQPTYPNKGKKYGLKSKDMIGIPWLLAFALRADGYYLRQDIIWHKPNVMPESVTDRCTKSHEYIFLLSKNANYYYNNEIIKENCSKECVDDFLRRKTLDNKNKGQGIYKETRPDLCRSREDYMPADFKRNKRDVWIVNTKPNPNAHFATYPEELITPCILAGSREGGIVLDPFMGSGTTAVTALKLLRKYIGCEINPEYIKIAEERIASERGLFN